LLPQQPQKWTSLAGNRDIGVPGEVLVNPGRTGFLCTDPEKVEHININKLAVEGLVERSLRKTLHAMGVTLFTTSGAEIWQRLSEAGTYHPDVRALRHADP
jgi:hypothetical protein